MRRCGVSASLDIPPSRPSSDWSKTHASSGDNRKSLLNRSSSSGISADLDEDEEPIPALAWDEDEEPFHDAHEVPDVFVAEVGPRPEAAPAGGGAAVPPAEGAPHAAEGGDPPCSVDTAFDHIGLRQALVLVEVVRASPEINAVS